MTASADAILPPAAEIRVAGRSVRLARPAKVLWPSCGFTKRDLVDYYLAVAPALLPHLAGRPVTLARFPDGVAGPGWYQLNCPAGRPEWLRVATVPSRGRGVLRYCLVDDAASLAWVANLGALELHPLLATADRPDAPRALVLDLDPGAPASLRECCAVALSLRDSLAAFGLRALPKTSGARGLHLFAPLDGAQSFAAAKGFARELAERLAARDPRVAAAMPKADRAGKVLVDWRQNDANRSTIAPYSLRATRVPLASAPLRWAEVERAAAGGELPRYAPRDLLARLEREGELFQPALELRQRLPK